MQILYSVKNGVGDLMFTRSRPDRDAAKKIEDLFPAAASEYPMYVSGRIDVSEKQYMFKAVMLKDTDSSDPGDRYIHAYAVEQGADGDSCSELDSKYFFDIGDIKEIERENSDYCTVMPTPSFVSGSLLSVAALIEILDAVYSEKDIMVTVPDNAAMQITACEHIKEQIFKYLDDDRKKNISVYFNTLAGYGSVPGFTLISDKKRLPSERCVSVSEKTVEPDESDIRAFVMYLVGSEPHERDALLDLVNRYGKYCRDGVDPYFVTVYKAFVECDEELITELVHKYCVGEYQSGRPIIIEGGNKTILRQSIRDRALIRSLYKGYTDMKFSDLIAKNKAETAFVSAFRKAGGLFTGDDAESCSLMLASNLVKDADGAQKAKLLENELEICEYLTDNAENPIELGMINAYKKVIASMSSESEFLKNVRGRVLTEIKSLVDSCDGSTLFSDGTDMRINKICENEGADRRDYFDETESMINARYREILADEIEDALDTVGKPTLTLERIEGFLKTEKDIISAEEPEEIPEQPAAVPVPSDDGAVLPSDDAFLKKLELINGMDIENYRAVYYDIVGSSALDDILIGDEDAASEEENEPYISLYLSKLASLFTSYDLFKREMSVEMAKGGTVFSAMLAGCREGYAFCYALDSSTRSSVSDIIRGFDEKRVDGSLFYPMLFKKLCEIVESEGDGGLIESLSDISSNETVSAILLAVKVKYRLSDSTQALLIDIERLAASYHTIKPYMTGDIYFDITVDGEDYNGISLDLFAESRNDPRSARVKSAAECSVPFNNFLYAMEVEGYEYISTQSGAGTESASDGSAGTADDVLDMLISDEKETPPEEDGDGVEMIYLTDAADNGAKGKKSENESVQEDFTEPEKLNISAEKQSEERLKKAIFVLSGLVVAAIILFIIFFI